MKKDAMLFNRPMLEALMDLLPDEAEDVRRLIEAAISFGLDGEEVDDVPRSVRAAWRFFKDNIQRDDERYSRICEQNRRNGAKGGRPRKNRETESVSEENPKNRTVISETERFSEKPNGFLENPKNPITNTNTITNTKEIQLTRDYAHARDNAPSCVAVPYPSNPSEVIEVATRIGKPMTEQQAQSFIDYYAAMGWMLRGGRITDWRRKVGNWCDRQRVLDARDAGNPADNLDRRDYSGF